MTIERRTISKVNGIRPGPRVERPVFGADQLKGVHSRATVENLDRSVKSKYAPAAHILAIRAIQRPGAGGVQAIERIAATAALESVHVIEGSGQAASRARKARAAARADERDGVRRAIASVAEGIDAAAADQIFNFGIVGDVERGIGHGEGGG